MISEFGYIHEPSREIAIGWKDISLMVDDYLEDRQTSLLMALKPHLPEAAYRSFSNLWVNSVKYAEPNERKNWSTLIDLFLRSQGHQSYLATNKDIKQLLLDIKTQISDSESDFHSQYESGLEVLTATNNGKNFTVVDGVKAFDELLTTQKKEEISQKIVEAVGAENPQFGLYIIGGAAKTDGAEFIRTASIVQHAMQRVLTEVLNAVVVDGATYSGFVGVPNDAMKMVPPEPRKRMKYVGFAPAENITINGAKDLKNKFHNVDKERFQVGYEHDVVVRVASHLRKHGKYGQWGNETKVMMAFCAAMDKKIKENNGSSCVIMMGGGQISFEELKHHIKAGRRVIVMKGSGRLADKVASGEFNTAYELRQVDPYYQRLIKVIDVADPQAEEQLVNAMREPYLKVIPKQDQPQSQSTNMGKAA